MRIDLHGRLGTARMLCGLLLVMPVLATAETDEAVIIECTQPCTTAIAAVRGLGGRVTQQFKNVDAVAARVPRSTISQLSAALGSGQVSKDRMVEAPIPRRLADVSAEGLQAEGNALTSQAVAQVAAATPNNYLFTGVMTGAATLHAQGKLGAGTTVAVIDSGTANWSGVPSLAGTVIGGENWVETQPGISATSRGNNPHGTWVGTMIAGHGLFLFGNSSALVQSIQMHAPDSVLPCPNDIAPTCPPTASIVPMIGTAPAAKIYALKVFPAPSGGAPESRIIAAMDRAITLRRNFNNGVPSTPVSGDGSEDNPFVYDSLKIDVVNMSLGGPTLFAGRDLEDQLTRKMLDVGMTLVTSAGNDGPAAMTGGSPGTGFGSLTTGAASTPIHERIWADVAVGFGLGALWRASDHVQTANFSSRGPTADGRRDPEMVANGDWSFAQAANGGINLVGGTSFSSPTVAGAAALLRESGPTKATATQIRNALVESANPNVLGDKSRANDQGKGFLDVPAALARLKSGKASKYLPDLFHIPTSLVALNVLLQGDKIVTFNKNDTYTSQVKSLLPGQMAQFFVPVDRTTDQLTVTISNVVPELPPEEQNQLFTDDVFVAIANAPTSYLDPIVPGAFVGSDTTFEIANPQTGLVRVALQGDWTNAGRVSAKVTINRTRAPFGKATAIGRVHEGEQAFVNVTIPPGTTEAVFDLSWLRNWGAYPTNDLDMVLIPPAGPENIDGATGASPERVVVANPVAGNWIVVVDGFAVREPFDRTPDEDWALRVTADGVRLNKTP